MPRNNHKASGYKTWLRGRHRLRNILDSASIFEVRVIVAVEDVAHYSSHPVIRKWIKETSVGLFHVSARTAEQACDKAEKYGRPIGARKIDRDKIFGNIEKLELNQSPLVNVYGDGNPYKKDNVYDNGKPYKDSPYVSALSLDEMRRIEREARIKNKEKDKLPY